MPERFGKIPLNLTFAAGHSLRRNAQDTGFETFPPGSEPHTHPESDVTNLITDLNGKAPASHAHSESDVTNLVTDLAGKAPTTHGHAQSEVTGLVTALA